MGACHLAFKFATYRTTLMMVFRLGMATAPSFSTRAPLRATDLAKDLIVF